MGGGVGSGGGVLGGEETGDSPNSGSSHSSLLSLRSEIATELTEDILLGVVDGEQYTSVGARERLSDIKLID